MTLDTNIIIAYLAGEQEVVEFLDAWRRQGGFLYISSIVETEVLAFSGWTDREKRQVERFLEENFILIPYDRKQARLAAQLRRNSKIKLPDAAIAATALSQKTPLLTRNLKDFKKVKSLQIMEI